MIKLKIDNSDTIYVTGVDGLSYKYKIESVANKIKKVLYKDVNESNFGRIHQHMQTGFFMVSACRGNLSEEENNERTERLAKDLRGYNLGYIRVLGGYVENRGQEDERDVTEESFFVPMPKNFDADEFFNIAVTLCKKYNQDSVLVSIPNSVEFGYYDKNGDFDFSPGDKFVIDDAHMIEYFSALVKGSHGNKRFTFTTEWLAVRYPASVPTAVKMKQNKEIY